MDRIPRSGEGFPRIDLLDERLKVTFDITSEALEHLPAITLEDRTTGRERFRILMGTVEKRGGNGVHISIKGIAQEEQDDTYGTYREGREEVGIYPTLMRDIWNGLVQHHPEFRSLRFIGDVHTHPTSRRAYPSEEDLRSSASVYESGEFRPYEPYVFGIVGIHESGEMECNFYRIVRTNSPSGYGFKLLQHPDE